jgi:uroporphyrinogen III methyltransferase/synthase
MNSIREKKGKIYLVGAGPGDPGLITVKAVECLNHADVVIYDFLANPILLAHASPEAEVIYVGKSASDHTLSQEGINELIVKKALEGKAVVRLKGGDPFIFGRGGEEVEELVQAGIDFEVVPGVTSAIAVPAYAGIPLTHREHTSSVAFITGHEDPAKSESSVDWDKIATGLGTLVFLMGVGNLPRIASRLIEAGRASDTPAAVIRWGTTPDQTTIVGTLEDIALKVQAAALKPPAILVVGGVVGLRSILNWYESLPLFGKRIMVTRTRAQASVLSSALTGLGAGVIECPTIRLAPPDDWSPVDRALDELTGFDWLVLTSPNGVDFLFERIREKGFDSRIMAPVKLAVIGSGTADRLAKFGLKADLMPEEFVAEDLARTLISTGMSGRKILLARSAQARIVLPEELTKAGAEVHDIVLYQTLPAEGIPEGARAAFKQDRLDLVTFTSSSTVSSLMELLDGSQKEIVSKIKAACIGPITARTAREAGLDIVVEAEEHSIKGLVQAIREYYQPGDAR